MSLEPKNVLIISYYWPPSGGSGVQRWVKFAKYLPKFGWIPIVFTPSNPEVPSLDESLAAEVEHIKTIKIPIFEPYGFYRNLTGSNQKVGAGFVSEEEKSGLLKTISVWIRGNLFIPDARKFFVRPAIKALSKQIQHLEIDAIITTGPPHSMHLIGQALSKKFSLPWIADFRDPWTQVYYFEDLRPSKWARSKHLKLEKNIISSADRVLVVSNGMAKDLSTIVDRSYDVVTNGFDLSDFNKNQNQNLEDDNKHFTITYSGTLLPSQYAENFWRIISELTSLYSIKIEFYGRIDVSTQNLIHELKLDSSCTFHGYVDHKTVTEAISKSDANLLILPNLPQSRHILTGKFFEYLAAKRPILAIGPKNVEIEELIQTHHAGLFFSFDEFESLKTRMTELIMGEQSKFIFNEIDKFSREALTKSLSDVLDQLYLGTESQPHDM